MDLVTEREFTAAQAAKKKKPEAIMAKQIFTAAQAAKKNLCPMQKI